MQIGLRVYRVQGSGQEVGRAVVSVWRSVSVFGQRHLLRNDFPSAFG